MDGSDITIESLRGGDHEVRWDLGGQAFGSTLPFDPDSPLPALDRIVAAYDGGRLAGTVVTLDFAMTWSGSSVQCGGVSGVVVRPEDRGRGLAKAMLRESFERMRTRGEVLAALYPTTATLYRSVGFEICGAYEWRKVPLDLVPGTGADLSWRRVEFDDPAIRTVHERMTSKLDGWLRTNDVWWGRFAHQAAADKTKNRYAYIGARGGQLDGIDVATVVYRYDKSEDRLYELGVDLIAGVDGQALASALGFLAGNATTAGHIETTVPRDLLTLHVPNMQHTSVTNEWPWMLRLVDVAGAFESRSFPTSVSGQVEVGIRDDTLPWNAGPHVIEFADGAARVSPGGSGAVEIDVTDLAAIYAGNDIRLRQLADRIAGTGDADLLAAACASHPTMPFFF